MNFLSFVCLNQFSRYLKHNLSPTVSPNVEVSATPLHMERVEKVFYQVNVEGVRLKMQISGCGRGNERFCIKARKHKDIMKQRNYIAT